MKLRSHTQRILLFAFIASIVACGLCGIYVLIVGNFSDFEGRVLASTASIGGAAILAMAAAIPWEKRRWPPIGLLGMISVAVALVMILLLIWTHFWRLETFIQSFGTACVFAVALPHVGLLSLARLRKSYEWIRYGTVFAIGCLALTVLWIIWMHDGPDDLIVRVIGVLGIIDVCGTIATTVLHRISGIVAEDSIQTVDATTMLSLSCPRCSKAQSLAIGRSKCAACGLHFRIEIEEEHCPKCGYSLYQLTSGVCPECGTPVAQAAPPSTA